MADRLHLTIPATDPPDRRTAIRLLEHAAYKLGLDTVGPVAVTRHGQDVHISADTTDKDPA